jgi:hypothetical protein
MTAQGTKYWEEFKGGGNLSERYMSTNITNKLAGTAALATRGSRSIGAASVRRLAADGLDAPGVFVTNGGYNGVQQVLRLSTPLLRDFGELYPGAPGLDFNDA